MIHDFKPNEAQVTEMVKLMCKNYNYAVIAEIMGLKEWQIQGAMHYIAENRMFNVGESRGNITMNELRNLEIDLFNNIEQLQKEPNNVELKTIVAHQQHRYSYALV